MHQLFLDRETFCELDLKEVGTYRYAEEAEDLLVSYAIDDGPAMVWDVTAEEMHDELFYAMEEAEEVIAHNAAFDKAIHNGPVQMRLPRIALERWRCSMAQALSHALPGSLADLCEVLNVPDDMTKLKEGKKLLNLFTRPQPGNRKVRRATRLTHPTEWERFKVYAGMDITAMRECVRRMPRWNWDASAIAEWHCDQRINERGFAVDTALTTAGIHAAETEKTRIGVAFRALTRGVVDRPSQRAQFMAYLASEFGLLLDNTTKDTFEQELKDPFMGQRCAELLRLSLASNKTSTAKYAALAPAVQWDGRFRGGLQFAGASRTRRWAGRMFQAQNLPSRGLPKAHLVDQYIEMLKVQSHDLYFGDELMRYGAAALRGVVIADEGKKLEVADLANIEGRMLSWVAHEAWKLDAFRAYDAGTGPDLYKVTASIVTGIPPTEVTKELRNSIGKVTDLASGYMGGASGYQTFARAYDVKLADYWGTLQRTVTPELIQRAKDNLLKPWGQESRASLEISETEWLAGEACKLAWRARHPATVKFWYALQDAAKNAINEWGQVFDAGRYIKVRCVTFQGQRWMLVKLPSGRYLTYFEPHLTDDGSLCYYGEAAEAGKTNRMWTRVFTHGGKLTGNCIGASAKVLTDKGAKPITQVRKGDRVWDGDSWVTTDGVVPQGRKRVGTWLGLQITPDHLILDGNSWRPVMQLDECSTRDALAWAASSVHSPSFAVTPETTALQRAFVPAAPSGQSTCDNCGGTRACGADGVRASACPSRDEETKISSPAARFGSCGRGGTKALSDVAQTPPTLRTPTTAAEASLCAPSGSPISAPFSSTRRPCPVGLNSGSISAGRKTTKGTDRETSGWCLGSSTPTTDGTIASSGIGIESSPSRSSGDATAPSGEHNPPSRTTWTTVGPPSGLWQSTTRAEEVFDLLNCGPNNRFTVLTDAGPVVIHNCCQTLARDVLMPALQEAEAEGYLPVLSVHDEAVCEVPNTDKYSAGGLVEILARPRVWAKGLPLAAAGFEAFRYKKED